MTAASLPFVAAYRPPAPVPHAAPLKPRQYIRALTDNPLTIWTQAQFEEPYVEIDGWLLGPRLIINDPDGIRHVLVDNEANYLRDDLQKRILTRTIGLGLFAAEGQAWRAQRRILAPLFAPRAVGGFLPAMAEAAAAGARRLADLPEGSVIDAAPLMSAIALDVLERTLFREGFGVPLAELSRHSNAFIEGAGGVSLLDLFRLPSWIPTLRALRAHRSRRFIGDMVDRMVAERRARLAAGAGGSGEGEIRDLLALLLDAADRETGIGLSDREVRDNVLTFIGAGHETTAGALAWTLLLLSGAPDVRAAVEAEIDSVLGTGPVTAETVADLVLTRATIEEAMRLYPSAPFLGRAAVKDDVIGGRPVKAGTIVMIVPWIIHRHQRLWSDPGLFDPGRFMPGRRDSIPRYAYLPFGAGPRVCIGSVFALQEAVIVLANALRDHRFDLVEGARIEPTQRITLRARYGIPMRVSRRRSSDRQVG
ncbi:cytochrome P450 [Prosthecomicrobium hirschii]|uniref:cytochrome P450 n=1 Tax=Prosthecodimorpha hirschii TaxID=665126 RepID=UPI00221EE3DE|nr:cytochrome P450 [Prosthecomicrobium hirschii]MCW1839048.1 cytochrome P450 [Prosthecomicrobium hirschii]